MSKSLGNDSFQEKVKLLLIKIKAKKTKTMISAGAVILAAIIYGYFSYLGTKSANQSEAITQEAELTEAVQTSITLTSTIEVESIIPLTITQEINTPTTHQTIVIPEITSCISNYWNPAYYSGYSAPLFNSRTNCWLLDNWGMYARNSQEDPQISGLVFSISNPETTSDSLYGGIYYDINNAAILYGTEGQDFSIPVNIYINNLVNGNDCESDFNINCDANLILGFGDPINTSFSGNGLFLVIRSSKSFNNGEIRFCILNSVTDSCDIENSLYFFRTSIDFLQSNPIQVEFSRISGVYNISINGTVIDHEAVQINNPYFWMGYVTRSENSTIDALIDLYP
jgi:hypothetical protein